MTNLQKGIIDDAKKHSDIKIESVGELINKSYVMDKRVSKAIKEISKKIGISSGKLIEAALVNLLEGE